MGDIERAADADLPLEAAPYLGRDDDEDHAAIRQHLEAFFDREGEELTWPHGVGAHRMGAFRVLAVPPNERTALHTYASIGAFALREPCVELVLLTAERSSRAVEIVATAAAYHHATGLRAGDRWVLGQPWLPGSACDAFLVSPPHPLGPTFERARGGTRPVRMLWLLPITPAERRFAHENGVAELELRFEDAPIEFWAPGRPSVV